MKQLIKQILPYSKESLMIDNVHKLESNLIIASKKVSEVNGHFDEFSITPAWMLIEGAGQAASLLIRYNLENHPNYDILAYKINNSKFSYPVIPPALVSYKVFLLQWDDKFPEFYATTMVGNNVVAELSFTLAIVDKKKFRTKHGNH